MSKIINFDKMENSIKYIISLYETIAQMYNSWLYLGVIV
jgi:hypothetical protein